MGCSTSTPPLPSFLPPLLLLLLICISNSRTGSGADFLYHFCSNRSGNYTANSTFQSNLDLLLSSLPSKPVTNGFYNFSSSSASSSDKNRVSAVGLCRGDVDSPSCRACIQRSALRLPRICPNYMEAIGWNNTCMLRYSSRSIFSAMEPCPAFSILNTTTTNDPNDNATLFNWALAQLLDSLKIKAAASNNSSTKFAAGSVTATGSRTPITIYALEQCTPDLSEISCSTCLEEAASESPNGTDMNGGWQIFRPSCSIRYELHQFYRFATTDSLLLLPPPPPRRNNGSSPPLSPGTHTNIYVSLG